MTALAGGPTLDITGSCPGVLSIDGFGFTPSGTVAVLKGSGPGSDLLPGGPCTGGVTSLGGLGFVTTLRADGGGRVSISPSIAAPICGAEVQFLDTSTCGLSNTDTLGDGGGGGVLVGSYDVNTGPAWSGAPETYSCKEACARLFGGGADGYSCSTSADRITGTAWLSEYGSAAYCGPSGIALPDDTKVCDIYSESGCRSAYINDNCTDGLSINYCFAL
jgi:hypothetical protein